MRIDFGDMWLQRYDHAVEHGVPARQVAEAMAAELGRLMDQAVRAAELKTDTQFLIMRCPHCGKDPAK